MENYINQREMANNKKQNICKGPFVTFVKKVMEEKKEKGGRCPPLQCAPSSPLRHLLILLPFSPKMTNAGSEA